MKNRTVIKLLFAFILAVAATAVFAGTGTVKNAEKPVKAKKPGKGALTIQATVDKPKITIGDKVTYTVIITHGKKTKVTIPDIADTLQSFELKDYKIFDPRKKRGKIINKFTFLVTTFTTGEFKIQSFTVKWVDRDGAQKESKSGEISIFVESVKASESDRDDIRDIKSPVNIKHSWWFYFLWIGLPLIVFMGFSVYYFTRKVQESGFFASKEPPKPADILAYERLDKLKEMELIEKGEIKKFYIIISEIIRRYLEARYDIQVLDMTTYELFQQLRMIGADKKHTAVIKDFLDECDMVKFARYVPGEKTISGDHELARKIIDITKSGLAQETGEAVESL